MRGTIASILPILRGKHTSLPEVGSDADFVCDILSEISIADSLIRSAENTLEAVRVSDSRLESRFSEGTFADGHRAAFEKAIRDFRPWKTAWKNRIQKRFPLERRSELQEWEKSIATELLQEVSSA